VDALIAKEANLFQRKLKRDTKVAYNKTHAADGMGGAGESVKLIGCLNFLCPQLMRSRYTQLYFVFAIINEKEKSKTKKIT
jgi:hypothetical protein